MKIKRSSLVLALVLGGLLAGRISSPAEDEKAPKRPAAARPAPAARFVERMNSRVQLTDEQKTKVTALVDEQSKQRREIFSNTNLTAPQKRVKLSALTEDENKKLKAILTPEQFEKWQSRPQRGRPAPGTSSAAAAAPAAPGTEKNAASKKSE